MSEMNDSPQRQAKWTEKTQVIENLIRECSERKDMIANAISFITKMAPPLNVAGDEVEIDDKELEAKLHSALREGQGTPSDSALSLSLDSLERMLAKLSDDLGEMHNLIDL